MKPARPESVTIEDCFGRKRGNYADCEKCQFAAACLKISRYDSEQCRRKNRRYKQKAQLIKLTKTITYEDHDMLASITATESHALDALGQEHKKAYHLYTLGYTPSEIATVTGHPARTVKRYISTAQVFISDI